MPRTLPTFEADEALAGSQQSWTGGIWRNPPSSLGFGGPSHDSVRARGRCHDAPSLGSTAERTTVADDRTQPYVSNVTTSAAGPAQASAPAPMGSGSLLASSETDDWRHSTTTIWRTRATPSPALPQPQSQQLASLQSRTAAGAQRPALKAIQTNQLGNASKRSALDTSFVGSAAPDTTMSSRGSSAFCGGGVVSDLVPGVMERPGRRRLSGNAKPFQLTGGDDDDDDDDDDDGDAVPRESTTMYPIPNHPYGFNVGGGQKRNRVDYSRAPAGFELAGRPSTASDAHPSRGPRHVPSFTNGNIVGQPLQTSTSTPGSGSVPGCARPSFAAGGQGDRPGEPAAYSNPRTSTTGLPRVQSAFVGSLVDQFSQGSTLAWGASAMRLPPSTSHDVPSNVQTSPRSTKSWGPTESDPFNHARSVAFETSQDAAFAEQLPSYPPPRANHRGSTSPSASGYGRSLHSPYHHCYSAGATPVTEFDQFHAHPRGAYAGRGVSDGHSMLLTSKLHGLQRQHQGHMPPSAGQSFTLPNETYMNSFSPQAYGANQPNAFGLGAMAQYLPAIGMWSESFLQPPMSLPLLPPPPPPRGPARALESGHPRSPLLEDFRANAKTNRRYELRDIIDHVVEFSGDQHGSRFIQQKLETANGEEKERIFAEILPNSVQLMKDVFGNYIIQKFFEHGTQHQKTILADQMKGQMLVLSLQTYGCRVVQKVG